MNEYIILPFFNQLTHADDFLQVKRFTNIDAINNSYSHAKIIIISNSEFLVIIKMIQALATEQRDRRIEAQCIAELILKGEPLEIDKIRKLKAEKINRIKLKE